MKRLKLVKYKNRKLYSPELSRYVSSAEVLDALPDVSIQCHVTRRDMTAEALCSLIPMALAARLGAEVTSQLLINAANANRRST